MTFFYRGLVYTALAVFSGAIALAQFESASLTGVATDATGATVSSVEVKAVNQATNIEANAVTKADGRFVFPSLRPGPYRVTASAKGFKQFVSEGIVLQVNQAAR